MATGADVRVDVPRYRVFRDGHLVAEPTDITQWWRPDLVAFLLGCSFTFEWALASAGLGPADQQRGANVPMYITNRQCLPAGRLDGPMVVTMRPFYRQTRPARRRSRSGFRRCTGDRYTSETQRPWESTR